MVRRLQVSAMVRESFSDGNETSKRNLTADT
jgi:hypothetical protein